MSEIETVNAMYSSIRAIRLAPNSEHSCDEYFIASIVESQEINGFGILAYGTPLLRHSKANCLI